MTTPRLDLSGKLRGPSFLPRVALCESACRDCRRGFTGEVEGTDILRSMENTLNVHGATAAYAPTGQPCSKVHHVSRRN